MSVSFIDCSDLHFQGHSQRSPTAWLSPDGLARNSCYFLVMVLMIPSLYNEFQVVSINLHKVYILFISLGGYYIYSAC